MRRAGGVTAMGGLCLAAEPGSRLMDGRRKVAHLWVVIALLAASASATGEARSRRPIGPGDRDELVARIESWLEAAAAESFSGIVLVARGEEIALHRGFGLADREAAVPVSRETVFDIGSITKEFTKAAILKLQERGKLRITDPIARHVPNVPADKAGITIEQLMNHAGGLREYHDTEGDFEPMSREQALDRILRQELLFAPGGDVAYSNSGYTLLAVIVELASGEAYPDFLRRYLLDPAELRRSGFYGERRWPRQEVAVGYGARRQGADNSPRSWPAAGWALMGNGGLVSSPAELHRWLIALRAGAVLPAAAVAKLHEEHARGTSGSPGYLAYAGGNDFGFSAVVFELREAGWDVIVASNTAGRHEAPAVGRAIARMILGREDRPNAHAAGAAGLQASLPDTPAGQRAGELLEVIRDGTGHAAERFLREVVHPTFLERFPMEQHLAIFSDLQRELADPEVVATDASGASSLAMTVRSRRTAESVRLRLEVEPAPPHRIVGLRLGGE